MNLICGCEALAGKSTTNARLSKRAVPLTSRRISIIPWLIELPRYLLGTPEGWEAAFLLLLIAAIDLFGGYMFNIALSRRTMDVAGPAI
jgi:hypothetical protein